MSILHIEIKGFSKFNPRSDLKSMPWFRLQNNFYDLEDFYDVSHKGCWLFVFLLCQCAQKVEKSIKMDENYLMHKAKMKKDEFYSALRELELKQVVKISTNESDRISTDSCLTNITNITNITERTNVVDRNQKISQPTVSDKKPTPKKSSKKKIHDELMDLWNRNAPNYNMPKITTIAGKRKKALDVALKEFPNVDDWRKIFSTASTKFFTKPDGSEFTPTWDYCFRNERYRELYDQYELLFEKTKNKSKAQLVRDVENILYSQL